MKYKVKALSLGGAANRFFKSGDIVNERDFTPNQTIELVKKGFLEIIPIEKKQGKRLVIATMAYQRYALFRLWCKYHISLAKQFKDLEIIILAVGDNPKIESICKETGVNYFSHPNKPLGQKANARLKFCKHFEPDWIMFLGSDDFICTDLLHRYTEEMETADIIEVLDLYYYDTISKTSVYCKGYQNWRKGEPMAVARCINYSVAEYFDWQLWDSAKRRGLDSGIYKRLKNSPFKSTQISIENKYLVLDVKTSFNMSKFAPKLRDNWIEISDSFFSKKLKGAFNAINTIK